MHHGSILPSTPRLVATGSVYRDALVKLSWLLDAMETHFAGYSTSCAMNREALRGITVGRRPTEDELSAAIHALSVLGVLSQTSGRIEFSAGAFRSTEGYRQGVREGLRARARPNGVALAAGLPPGLPKAAKDAIHARARDLRAALVDCIASANHRIVLASPFWDEETTDELADLLSRRKAAGVLIDLIGREVGGLTPSGQCLAELVRRLGEPSKVRATGWLSFSQTKIGVQTFHFKCAIADGERAYLGSANFTTGGLRSRMELGVILSGEVARSLAQVLDTVLEVARGTHSS